MNTKEFLEIVENIKSIYGTRLWNIQERALDMWFECLKDLNADWLRTAIINYAKGNEYPPTVAALRKEYGAIEETEQSYRTELKRLYDLTIAVYPSAEDSDLTRELYTKHLENVPKESRLGYARNFFRQACIFVRNCENSDSSYIPDFTQFLKGDVGK